MPIGTAVKRRRQEEGEANELSGQLLADLFANARAKAYVFRSEWKPAKPPSKTEVRAAIHRAALSTHNPSPFRFLSEAEIAAIDSWAKRGKIPAGSPILKPMTTGTALDGNGAPYGTRADDTSLLLRDYLRVSYHRTQGGFTICTLSFRYAHPRRGASHEIRTGASRRSFKDAYNPVKGEMLALFRAVRAQAVTLP